jgi:hypothetical protein
MAMHEHVEAEREQQGWPHLKKLRSIRGVLTTNMGDIYYTDVMR